jgi:hypothetical protein
MGVIMLVDHTSQRRRRALIHALGIGLAGAAIALAVLLPTPAEAADLAQTRGEAAELAETRSDLTWQGPPTNAIVEIDPFRAFSDCLAAAAHSDSMYPGIDPSEVNSCLEDHGLL